MRIEVVWRRRLAFDRRSLAYAHVGRLSVIQPLGDAHLEDDSALSERAESARQEGVSVGGRDEVAGMRVRCQFPCVPTDDDGVGRPLRVVHDVNRVHSALHVDSMAVAGTEKAIDLEHERSVRGGVGEPGKGSSVAEDSVSPRDHRRVIVGEAVPVEEGLLRPHRESEVALGCGSGGRRNDDRSCLRRGGDRAILPQDGMTSQDEDRDDGGEPDGDGEAVRVLSHFYLLLSLGVSRVVLIPERGRNKIYI